MNTLADQQLSSEVQELYLQNKVWLSDILYLEDETRFFQKLLDSSLSSVVKEGGLEEVQLLNTRLKELEERRNQLKSLVINHQHLLESILEDQTKYIGLDLIDENAKIINKIKTLFISDKLIKKELFTLVERVIGKDKAEHLPKA